MGALRWVLLGMALAGFILFAIPNWSPVTLKLGNWELLIQLPVLVLAAFLLGLVPTWLLHVAARSGWRRRLARAEKAVTDTVLRQNAPAVPATPAMAPNATPPAVQPTIVPPAGA